MELIKEVWDEEAGQQFQEYLKTLGKKDRVEWTKNNINTQMDVLAVPTQKLREIIKEIAKGDFMSFLNLNLWQYHENTIINAGLIAKIKEFYVLENYLKTYTQKIDNWASCDMFSVNVSKNEQQFFDLAVSMLVEEKPFVRRMGFNILFKFITNEKYIDKLFSLLNNFNGEKEYYVNMMIAWFVCELFIKQREKTLEFLNTHNLNTFQINKAISKCRDSFRVSEKDKQMLLQYKK